MGLFLVASFANSQCIHVAKPCIWHNSVKNMKPTISAGDVILTIFRSLYNIPPKTNVDMKSNTVTISRFSSQKTHLSTDICWFPKLGLLALSKQNWKVCIHFFSEERDLVGKSRNSEGSPVISGWLGGMVVPWLWVGIWKMYEWLEICTYMPMIFFIYLYVIKHSWTGNTLIQSYILHI